MFTSWVAFTLDPMRERTAKETLGLRGLNQ